MLALGFLERRLDGSYRFLFEDFQFALLLVGLPLLRLGFLLPSANIRLVVALPKVRTLFRGAGGRLRRGPTLRRIPELAGFLLRFRQRAPIGHVARFEFRGGGE